MKNPLEKTVYIIKLENGKTIITDYFNEFDKILIEKEHGKIKNIEMKKQIKKSNYIIID